MFPGGWRRMPRGRRPRGRGRGELGERVVEATCPLGGPRRRSMQQGELDGPRQLVGQGNRLVLAVELGDAVLHAHAQHAQHDGDQPAEAGASDIVEVVAWQVDTSPEHFGGYRVGRDPAGFGARRGCSGSEVSSMRAISFISACRMIKDEYPRMPPPSRVRMSFLRPWRRCYLQLGDADDVAERLEAIGSFGPFSAAALWSTMEMRVGTRFGPGFGGRKAETLLGNNGGGIWSSGCCTSVISKEMTGRGCTCR